MPGPGNPQHAMLSSGQMAKVARYNRDAEVTPDHEKRATAMEMDLPSWLLRGIDSYGYWVVLLAVAIESMGVPFPGETTLVAGAVYASTQHSLNITLVIAAAAVGAILGDNVGYSIGSYGGFPLLQRILRLLHIGEDKLIYTQRFFEQHGDKTVFLGRFLAILRTWAAFLAGANHMRRRTFFIWNAAGGIVWATIYGLLGYVLGDNLPLLGRILKDLGIFGFVVVAAVIVAAIAIWLLRRWRVRMALHNLTHDNDRPVATSQLSDGQQNPGIPSRRARRRRARR